MAWVTNRERMVEPFLAHTWLHVIHYVSIKDRASLTDLIKPFQVSETCLFQLGRGKACLALPFSRKCKSAGLTGKVCVY